MVINCCSYHFYFTLLIGWLLLVSVQKHAGEQTSERYNISGTNNFFETDANRYNFTEGYKTQTDTSIGKETNNQQIP